MTTRQAAEFIGIHQKTLINQIRRGVLPAVKFGAIEGVPMSGMWLVRGEDAVWYKRERKGRVGRPSH